MVARTSLIVVSIATASLLAAPGALAQTPKASQKKAAKPAAADAKKPAVVADARPGKQAQVAPSIPASPMLAAPVETAPAAAAPQAIDPLEAALAQALGHATAVAAPDTRPAARPSAGGLSELGALSQSAARASLLGSKRDRSIPAGEVVEHMKAATLGQNDITTVILAQRHQLAYCHQSLLARGKQAEGDASLRFVVEPRGNVSSVRVDASGADGKLLERCIERRVAKWRFPQADAPTTVDYPLVFDTARDAGAK